MINRQKISNKHLQKKAVIYLRQSSPGQVLKNKESLRLQYALADHARDLGWADIEVLDEDLGKSAAEGNERSGFKKLIAGVATGDIGAIFSREASRLSRTDKDWCHLLEICKLTTTLIGDGENIYDISLGDDQLLLGIKATLSVAELMVQKSRLKAGRESKAARGELFKLVSPGYVVEGNVLVMDPDLRIQEAIRLVFTKINCVTSVRQLMKWFHSESIELPLNKKVAGKWGIGWQLPKYTFLKYILQNPVYAGAYYYGRTETKKVIIDGKIRHKVIRHKPQDSRVFIKDHHESYITWQEFEANQKMIEKNNQRIAKGDGSISGIRQGRGILTGLVRCGHCGRKLHVRYSGKSGTAARYICKGDFDTGGKYCISFGGATIDNYISENILQTLSPFTLDASLAAIQKLEHRQKEKERDLELKIQQQEYEVQRAFEQYDKVDPKNRLVVDQLEARWNLRLSELDLLITNLESLNSSQKILNIFEKNKILSIGENFGHFWKNRNIGRDIKKKIVRILLKEIIVTLDKKTKLLTFILHWQGGSHTQISMPKPLPGKSRKSNKDNIDIIRKMAIRYQDKDIAIVLAKLDRKNKSGIRWNEHSVGEVRKKFKLPNPQTCEDILTLGQAEKHAGVSDTTLMKLIKKKILTAAQIVPYAPYEISKADLDANPVHSILLHLKNTGKLVFDRVPLVNQRPLF